MSLAAKVIPMVPGSRRAHQVVDLARAASRNVNTFKDAAATRNPKVLLSLAGPALRGFVLQRGKTAEGATIASNVTSHFNWKYEEDEPQFVKLYSQAKRDQWDGDDLPWDLDVDPMADTIFDETMLPLNNIRAYRNLPKKQRAEQRHQMLCWLLSQFLHGEQGALFAACQVTEAVTWMDGKLYGSTQVIDEGRHVEVFQRYLKEKLGRVYDINDNLYVILDALMTDGRWDLKFLGMQIFIEGLALGAFGAMRSHTQEPLLKQLLRMVITDEARHVHFGVVALQRHYNEELTAPELREREDWAFEMALLMRNRFLGHEFYDEYWGHAMSRKAWDDICMSSAFMEVYRRAMFKRIIPNLKRINLLSDRMRRHYAQLGLLQYEHELAAPEVQTEDLMQA